MAHATEYSLQRSTCQECKELTADYTDDGLAICDECEHLYLVRIGCCHKHRYEYVAEYIECGICGDLPRFPGDHYGFAHVRCRKCGTILCCTCSSDHHCS